MSAWWTGISPAEAVVECGGHAHTLRWESGELTALDHGDPEDEATLAALAGETFACLELLRAWARRREDPRVLTLGSRGPTDALDINLETPQHFHRAPPRRSELELERLLALGGGLPDRLQANAAATWTRRLRTGHCALESTRPQLHAALYGRLLATLRPWLGEPALAVALTMADADGERLLARRADGIAVALPFAWVSEVWVRGLAVVFGRLCLAAESTGGPGGAGGVGWTLTTVGPELGVVETLTLGVA